MAQHPGDADVQATLTELTAATIANAIGGAGCRPKRVILCGGGARNGALTQRLAARLEGIPVESSALHGIEPGVGGGGAVRMAGARAVARRTGQRPLRHRGAPVRTAGRRILRGPPLATLAVDTLNLKLPDHYVNRELSQLEFNMRVLQQARDETVPLLERLKFLCISSTNLDEFFEIRVSGLKQRLEIRLGAHRSGVHDARGSPADPGGQDEPAGDRPIPGVERRTHSATGRGRHPLRAAGRVEAANSAAGWRATFHTEVVSVLSPTTLDPTRPIPRILNKSLNFIVSLHGRDAFGRQRHRAIVQAPRSLPRLIQLPRTCPAPAAPTSCCCPPSSMPSPTRSLPG